MQGFLNNFIVFFIVVDPIGVAWLFAAMTQDVERRVQIQMALRATIYAGGILLLFLFSGALILDWFGITISAFRIAGGALLFLISIDMVFARQSGLRSTTSAEQIEAIHKQDVSVFPLAFPLLAGPGAITTLLLASSISNTGPFYWELLLVLALVFVITLLFLLSAPMLARLLGQTGANVISRIFGLILAALAMQYIIDGVISAFLTPLK